MSKEKKLSKKALYSDELGKIGRAAERGGPVNKVQKEHGEYSEQVMYANKMKNMPFKKKLEELGLQLTVAAATNPELGRGVVKTFTGNPVTNIKDALTRQNMIRQNMRSRQEALEYQIGNAERKLKQWNEGRLPAQKYFHPSAAKAFPENAQRVIEGLKVLAKKENVYNQAVKTANEDMALIQTNRAMKKALDKVIKEESRRFRLP